MRKLSLGEGKGGLEVLLEESSILVGLDGSHDLLVNLNLILLPLLGGSVFLLLSLEDISLLLGLLLSLDAGKVGVVHALGQLIKIQTLVTV